ncbi:unnamed protein product, partial [Ilex paraguariensis]
MDTSSIAPWQLVAPSAQTEDLSCAGALNQSLGSASQLLGDTSAQSFLDLDETLYSGARGKIRGINGDVEAPGNTSASAQVLGDTNKLLGGANVLGSVMRTMGSNDLGLGDASPISRGFGSTNLAMKTLGSTQTDGARRQMELEGKRRGRERGRQHLGIGEEVGNLPRQCQLASLSDASQPVGPRQSTQALALIGTDIEGNGTTIWATSL